MTFTFQQFVKATYGGYEKFKTSCSFASVVSAVNDGNFDAVFGPTLIDYLRYFYDNTGDSTTFLYRKYHAVRLSNHFKVYLPYDIVDNDMVIFTYFYVYSHFYQDNWLGKLDDCTLGRIISSGQREEYLSLFTTWYGPILQRGIMMLNRELPTCNTRAGLLSVDYSVTTGFAPNLSSFFEFNTVQSKLQIYVSDINDIDHDGIDEIDNLSDGSTDLGSLKSVAIAGAGRVYLNSMDKYYSKYGSASKFVANLSLLDGSSVDDNTESSTVESGHSDDKFTDDTSLFSDDFNINNNNPHNLTADDIPLIDYSRLIVASNDNTSGTTAYSCKPEVLYDYLSAGKLSRLILAADSTFSIMGDSYRNIQTYYSFEYLRLECFYAVKALVRTGDNRLHPAPKLDTDCSFRSGLVVVVAERFDTSCIPFNTDFKDLSVVCLDPGDNLDLILRDLDQQYRQKNRLCYGWIRKCPFSYKLMMSRSVITMVSLHATVFTDAAGFTINIHNFFSAIFSGSIAFPYHSNFTGNLLGLLPTYNTLPSDMGAGF